MMLANVPVVFAGDALMRRVPLQVDTHRRGAVFLALGVYALVFAVTRTCPGQGASHESHCSKLLASQAAVGAALLSALRLPTCASAGR